MRKRDWLSRYLQYTNHIESPEIFHLWGGISCISAALSRSVYVDMGYGAIYPNFYVVLVAPPGRCRKGAACKAALPLIENVIKPNKAAAKGESPLNLIRESITKRALTLAMGEQVVLIDKKPIGNAAAFVYAPEFSVFMGSDAANNGLLDALLTLYDCPDRWEHRTSSQGKDFLFNSWLGILGASTPSLLSRCVLNETVGGGITSRTIFVARIETPRKTAYYKKDEEWYDLRDELIEDLNKIAKIEGKLDLSSEALSFYSSWYEDREVPKDERFATFYEREHDHVLKTAIVLAASGGDLYKSNVVAVRRVEEALTLIEGVKESMHLVYQGLGEHPAARGYDRVYQQIREMGGMVERSKLMNMNWYYYSKDVFDEIMELLEETQKVKREMTRNGKTFYRAIQQKDHEI